MSKLIKITSNKLDEIRKDFEEALKNIKMSDGKFNFTTHLDAIQRKATLYFTEVAYMKMLTLVREFDKEVAWHGIAKRCESEEDAYVISDILVYPQEVTGATVTTDQEKYQTWLMSHDDDVFNNIRMQGHSHVNMGTSPSAVDTSLYERILSQLDDDMFYIFLIWNKRNEKTIKIYDLAKNVLFETADVTVDICDEEFGIDKFLKAAKEMVQNKPAANSYWSYGEGNYGVYGQKKTTTGRSSDTTENKQGGKKSTTIDNVPVNKKKKLKELAKEDWELDYGRAYNYYGCM